MKLKTMISLLFVTLIMIFLSSNVFAADSTSLGTATLSDGNQYEFFDDNTATLILLDVNQNTIKEEVDNPNDNSDTLYTVTKIGANALDNITNKQDLYVDIINAPTLETDDPKTFFANIDNIYIHLSSNLSLEWCEGKGYTDTGSKWLEVEDKLKNYQFTKQPQSETTVTAGGIDSTHVLTVEGKPAVCNGSWSYQWYYCDANGNLLGETISSDVTLQIPTNLSYDHDTNGSKTYYFRCVLGDSGNILEYSDIAKVTVQPGVYKVTFILDSSSPNNTKVVSVNSQRKLDASNIPNQSELAKEGAEFLGWTTDDGNIVDLSTMTFDKNTTLSPVWRTKLIFDANDGKFADGSTIQEVYITNTELGTRV